MWNCGWSVLGSAAIEFVEQTQLPEPETHIYPSAA